MRTQRLSGQIPSPDCEQHSENAALRDDIGVEIAAAGAALVVLAGWGASWLQSEYGLGTVEAAQPLSVSALASAVGARTRGTLPRIFQGENIVIPRAPFSQIVLTALALCASSVLAQSIDDQDPESGGESPGPAPVS
jgi:hypothetical protein